MPPTWDNLSRKKAQCGQGGTIWAAPGYCTSGDVGYYMRGRIREGWGLVTYVHGGPLGRFINYDG